MFALFREREVLVGPEYDPGPGPAQRLPGPPGRSVLLQVALPGLQRRPPGDDVIVARTHGLHPRPPNNFQQPRYTRPHQLRATARIPV